MAKLIRKLPQLFTPEEAKALLPAVTASVGEMQIRVEQARNALIKEVWRKELALWASIEEKLKELMDDEEV